MRSPSLVLILSLSSLGLPAQQSRATQPTTFIIPTSGIGCPVGFGAELNTQLILRSASDQSAPQSSSEKKHDDAPLLELTFHRLETPRIVRATVSVHGLSAKGLFLPASNRTSANRTQIFTLNQESDVRGLARREVKVTGMPFVRWAEVTELNYADGTAWHASPDQECRAALSLFHLIDAPASTR